MREGKGGSGGGGDEVTEGRGELFITGWAMRDGCIYYVVGTESVCVTVKHERGFVRRSRGVSTRFGWRHQKKYLLVRGELSKSRATVEAQMTLNSCCASERPLRGGALWRGPPAKLRRRPWRSGFGCEPENWLTRPSRAQPRAPAEVV